VNARHLPVGLKQRAQFRFRRLKAHIADKKILHNLLLNSTQPSRRLSRSEYLNVISWKEKTMRIAGVTPEFHGACTLNSVTPIPLTARVRLVSETAVL
jgi:hypothetical protein